MTGWERVRGLVTCAYGCAIPHPEWAWWGRFPFVVCESCAAKYGIVRSVPVAPVPGEPDGLVPASPEPHVFTSLEALADDFKADPAGVLRAATRTRPKR